MIEHNYVQYLGITQAIRLSQPKFMEQFRRMLVSKLRVVFENASGELELWNKTASSQVDSQLRERRRGFKRRREALERIQSAAGELEQRIGEFEAQDARLQQFQAQVGTLLQSLRQPQTLQDLPELDIPVLNLSAGTAENKRVPMHA
jgi:DNA repair exonuclease SbcCD ATPase subunit